jgi:hypothetical protein
MPVYRPAMRELGMAGLSLLAVLALATAAYAECAWVLWAESRVITSNAAGNRRDYLLHPTETYESNSQCLAAVAENLTLYPARKDAKSETRTTLTGYATVSAGGGMVPTDWRCWSRHRGPAWGEVKMMATKVPLLVPLLVMALLAGCESLSLRSTPQQAYTYDLAAPCRTLGFVNSFTAHRSGNYWVYFQGSGPAVFSAPRQFNQCMEDQLRLQPFDQWLKKNWQSPPTPSEARDPHPQPAPY